MLNTRAWVPQPFLGIITYETLFYHKQPVVIESQFGLPGLGRVLDSAIRSNDFLVIYGVVLFVTVAVATLMAVMEFVYPLLDPRIKNT